MNLQKIFDDTDFVHTSGTKEELQVADGIVSEGKKSKKLAKTAETAVGKYNQGDQRVQALF